MTWQTWLAPLEFDRDDHTVTVTAPSQFHVTWIREKHEQALAAAIEAVYGPGMRLVYEVADAQVTFDFDEEEGEVDSFGPEPRPQVTTSSSKYTFDNFVVGPSNRFAHAAAMAVAERPGMHYNPLFVYAGAGLGKTHLLHAVGHHRRELDPEAVVRYVTSERFFSEFIDGIRQKRMDAFKAKYRTTDLLLLDDVQFLEGKEQILEEFFHTFNSLYEAGKQMVISSDRHPKHLATLEDRIRSRFEWGLLTDIQPPDVETRLAILHKNSEFAPQSIPEEVLTFIADHVRDNIRELEGALTRITAYAELTEQTISLAMAEDVLQDLTPRGGPRPVTPDEIIAASAASYGFSVSQLKSRSRKQPLVRSRQIAMYLCRELTDLSLPKIGALFGGRDHTTVMHAIDKITTLMRTDPTIFEKVTTLSQQLRRN